MLYYLTGMATERSAVLAYNLLHRGTLDMGEDAIAETVIGQIKRQEPGHFAFYQLSARGLWSELAPWQRWMVRLMRRISFAPVGANNAQQKADFGDVMATLGIDRAPRRLRRADLPGREGAALGPRPRAQGPRLRLRAPSARPSSWPATARPGRTCTADAAGPP